MEQINGISFPDYGKARDYLVRQTTTIANLAAETTILAAVAGRSNDIYVITGSNSSDQVIPATIRDTTTGAVVIELRFPASTATTFTFNPPLKQTTPNTNWTLAMTSGANSNTSIVYYVCAASVPQS